MHNKTSSLKLVPLHRLEGDGSCLQREDKAALQRGILRATRTGHFYLNLRYKSGFTLLDLMIAIVIISILTAIAIPTYQQYVRRATESIAQQELLKISALLEQYRTRNFSYQGFDLTQYPQYQITGTNATTATTLSLPIDSTGTATQKYVLSIANAGTSWAMTVKIPTGGDARLYNFLLTSAGIRCKTQTVSQISYSGCGAGSVSW